MGKEVWHDPAFKVYRGLGNIVILLLCWGVDVLVWKRVSLTKNQTINQLLSICNIFYNFSFLQNFTIISFSNFINNLIHI